MTILQKTVAIPHDALIEAICLRTSECFTAMALANALAGQRTDAWELAHNHSLAELLDEADRLGISLKDAKTAVDEKPVMHSPFYLLARGLITTNDYQVHRNLLKGSRDERAEARLKEIEDRFAVLGELARTDHEGA